jgi:hypothetical protein
MTLTYGLIITIPITLFLLWGFYHIRRKNKDLVQRQLCMIFEKDFLSFADRNEMFIEGIIDTINVIRRSANEKIKTEKMKIPLLTAETFRSLGNE